MKLIVYFYTDQTVALIPSEDCNLGEFEDFSISDWKNLKSDIADITAVYDNCVYRCSVLMVVEDDKDDCASLLPRLQSLIARKKLSLSSIIAYCKDRVKRGRVNLPPLKQVSTSDDCSSIVTRPKQSSPPVLCTLPSHSLN